MENDRAIQALDREHRAMLAMQKQWIWLRNDAKAMILAGRAILLAKQLNEELTRTKQERQP